MKPRMNCAKGVLVMAAAALLQACAVSGSPEWDSRFGDAVRQLQAQQSLDPNAPRRDVALRPRTDGRSALLARERYLDSFAAPPGSSVVGSSPGGK